VRVHQAAHPIAILCRVLGVSPSGYYAWCARPASARATADAELSAQIRAIHERSRGTYGERRIHAELCDLGVHVSRKRIARLMRAMGLAGVSRRKFTTTTARDRDARPAPDLVDRNFTAPGPDQLWVADISVPQQAA
jgi:putative transposase